MTTVRQMLEHKGRAVYSVGPDDPVLTAIRMMAEQHVGALLVMRDGELVGIISERDYARKVILLGRSSSETPVSTSWNVSLAVRPSSALTCSGLSTPGSCTRIRSGPSR